MVSYRKSYRDRFEGKDAAPTAATPQESAAKLPDVVETKPVGTPVESDPVKEAGHSALLKRLKEMDAAESAVVQQQPQYADEPQRPQQQPPTVEQALAH